jgi:hypothetical protein
MSWERGPYLQLAIFCERVLHEQDGVVSLIRVIDRVTHTVRGKNPPTDLPPFEFEMFAVISLKPGEARGRHEVRIERELPNGVRDPASIPPLTVQLEGEERGANIVMNLRTKFEHEGLHWFHVYFDGELMTKMPLRVLYSRAPG